MHPATTSDASQQNHFYLEQIKVSHSFLVKQDAFAMEERRERMTTRGLGAGAVELTSPFDAQGMADFKLTTLYVDYQHLMDKRDILAKAVTEQYYRCALSLTTPARLSSRVAQLPPLPPPRSPEPRQEIRPDLPLHQLPHELDHRRRTVGPHVLAGVLQPPARRGDPRHADGQDWQAGEHLGNRYAHERGSA